MKPSIYNFTWPVEDTEKVIIFNSLTTSLAEVGKTHIDLLNAPRFDYDTLTADARQFVDGLMQGGYVLDDSIDELKILKFAYNSAKYDRMRLDFTIAPTLRCNFSCAYCYEKAGEDEDKRDGHNAFMPEHVQQGLLKFIERATKVVKRVSISWFGGEPLLGKDIIFDLTKKITAITEAKGIDYSAGMITNGYLIAKDPGIVQKMKDCHIRTFQITLDGPPDVHNRRRTLKGDGGPTFDRIMEGITLLRDNQMDVSLRINVDRSNMDDALRLLDILEDNNLKDVGISLGHVSANTAGCKSIESSCATMEEFTVLDQTFQETLRQRGFKAGQTPYYPRMVATACAAYRMNNFVLDPDGDMYRCLSEIGDKRARIGNIVNFRQRSKTERMREIQWLTWEPFEYEDCAHCKVLPICMGSCGYRAMYVNKDRPDCAEWKYSLEHYVRERFKREKERRAAGKQMQY